MGKVNIGKSLPFTELETVEGFDKRLELLEGLQQVLSILTAFDGIERRLLRCSKDGALKVRGPVVDKLWKTIVAGDGETGQLMDWPCSQVAFLADSTNTGVIRLCTNSLADIGNGWPLNAGDSVIWPVNNVHDVFYLAEKTDDILYYAIAK